MNHYKCDRCGLIVEGEAHTDVDNDASPVTLCDNCYEWLCNAPVQTIYFDAEDDNADGFGWNVVDGGAIAARFSTLVDAMAWCGKGRYVLRPLAGAINRRVTADEIAAINENLKAL